MGVGGAGMSSLARFLLKKNFAVSGCDIQYSENIRELEEEGLVFLGPHSKKHVYEADVLVYSSAIPENHPEIEEAKKTGKIAIKRIELLSEILNVRKSVAVIGSHGKTTTTSLIAHAMKKLGISSIAIIGGILRNGDISQKPYKEEEFAVAEVDESDKDFLKISPFFAVITNIDEEHLDKWGEFNNLKKAILNFANSVPIWGVVVLNIDDPGVRSISTKIKRKIISCSIERCVESQADIVAKNISFYKGTTSFDLGIKKSLLGVENSPEDNERGNENKYFFIKGVKLGVSGRHNVSNSLLAFGTLLALKGLIGEFDLSYFSNIFLDFAGVKRRMDLRCVKNGIYVIDDYAHHPSEIKATLEAIKLTYKGKIVLVFEPHRYSRVAYLKDKFRSVLKEADMVILTDIYPASEKNVWGVCPHDIIGDAKNVEYVEFSHVIDRLKEILPNLSQGDIIVFMGAGNIKKLADEFIGSK